MAQSDEELQTYLEEETNSLTEADGHTLLGAFWGYESEWTKEEWRKGTSVSWQATGSGWLQTYFTSHWQKQQRPFCHLQVSSRKLTGTGRRREPPACSTWRCACCKLHQEAANSFWWEGETEEQCYAKRREQMIWTVIGTAQVEVEASLTMNFSFDLQNQTPRCFTMTLLLLCIKGLLFLKSTAAGSKVATKCPSQDSLHCISILKCALHLKNSLWTCMLLSVHVIVV